MKQIVLCVGVVLLSAMVHAKDLVVTIDGKEVKMDCTIRNYEIKASDKDGGSQTNVMGCSFLFHSLLAKGDIQGAANITSDSAATVEKWTKYLDRVGLESFKKMEHEYFISKNVLLAEIVYGNDTMLVIKTKDYTAGQFYQKKDGKYLMTDKPAAADTLGKVLSMIQEDQIKL